MGPGLVWMALTFEIGRHTLLTGRGVFKGFFRLNRAFGVGLWILFTVSFLWFGAFASAGGTAIAAATGFPFGWERESQSLFWAQSSIIVPLVGMMIACCHPTVRAEFVTLCYMALMVTYLSVQVPAWLG